MVLPYSALELYLAGLAPADEVPDWIVGVDADFSFHSRRYELKSSKIAGTCVQGQRIQNIFG